MGLENVVETLNARRIGRDRFMAKCPAHDDRIASVSISLGRDRRVLLHCFAGCTAKEVLASAGLTINDLFNGPPPTAAQLKQAEQHRAEVAAVERGRGDAQREYWNALREGWEQRDRLVKRLAAKIMNGEHDETLTVLLHDALEERRSFDRALLGDPDDCLPMEKPVPPKPYRLVAR